MQHCPAFASLPRRSAAAARRRPAVRAPALSRAQAEAIVASPDRSDADRRNDVRRKPVEMLSFIGAAAGLGRRSTSAPAAATRASCSRAPSRRPAASTRRRRGRRARRSRRALKTPAGAQHRLGRPALRQPGPGRRRARRPRPRHADVQLPRLRLDGRRPRAPERGGLRGAQARRRSTSSPTTPAGPAPASRSRRRCTASRSRWSSARSRRRAFASPRGVFLRNPADPRDREEPDPPMPKDEFVLKFVKP